MFARGFVAEGVDGGEAGGFEEPGGEGGAGFQRMGFLGQEEEDGLGDFLREGVVIYLAEGGGVDEGGVFTAEGGEGGLARRGGEVAGEEGGVDGGWGGGG